MTRYLTANEAAERLQVSRATLYAYVSRGQIRSEPIAGTRTRRYHSEDIDSLVGRKRARSHPEKAASDSLHFGGWPVLESSLTLLDGERLHYRGLDAIELSRTACLEDVAQLLWDAPVPDLAPQEEPVGWDSMIDFTRGLSVVAAWQVFLSLAGPADPAGFDLRPESVRRAGARILRGLTAVSMGVTPVVEPVADTLVRGWAVTNKDARDAIRAALVLTADHELNASAFTARCIASAGATPYAVVTGALASLSGHKHGGQSELVARLFEDAATLGSEEAIARRLRTGERLPGFDHPLYHDGDPRGRRLIELASAARGSVARRASKLADAIAREAMDKSGLHPNLDFGLAVVARAFGLAREAPFVLFGLGRTVGWIAHALEQYGLDRIIRPRARYSGPTPRRHSLS
ncbi:MAG: citrate synthase family protein [Planctomycetota bacterium]